MNLNPYRGLYNLGRKIFDDALPGLFKKMGAPESIAQGAGALLGSFAGVVGAMMGGIAVLSAVIVLPHFVASYAAAAPMTALLGTLVTGGVFIGGGSLGAALSFGMGNKFFKAVKNMLPGPKSSTPDAGAEPEDFGATISPVSEPSPGMGATISPVRVVVPDTKGATIIPAQNASEEFGATISPARQAVPEPMGATISPAPRESAGATFAPAALLPEFKTAVEGPKPDAEPEAVPAAAAQQQPPKRVW